MHRQVLDAGLRDQDCRHPDKSALSATRVYTQHEVCVHHRIID